MKTALSLILSASIALAACTPERTTDGDNNVILDTSAAVVASAPPPVNVVVALNEGDDSDDPIPLGGMCTGPKRCPPNYYYVGPPTCSCLPKPKGSK